MWLALSWGSHAHSKAAWNWLHSSPEIELLLCRFTTVGLLRLLTTKAVMGADCVTVGEAWAVVDRWQREERVRVYEEPAEFDRIFRGALSPFLRSSSPKAIGDCYLLAMSQAAGSTLVTFDRGLYDHARKAKHEVVHPR